MSEHLGFIAAAYGFTALVIVTLIAWSLAEYRAQSRALAELEARLGRSE
jgi:heme exporter protein D